MKILLTLAFAMFAFAPQQRQVTPDDYSILSDRTVNDVRTIIAVPAPMVCCKQITIEVDAGTTVIRSVVYKGGCNGNLKAVNALVKGMTVKEAVSKLDGIDCGGRGTSCTDQLARVLKHCFKL